MKFIFAKIEDWSVGEKGLYCWRVSSWVSTYADVK